MYRGKGSGLHKQFCSAPARDAEHDGPGRLQRGRGSPAPLPVRLLRDSGPPGGGAPPHGSSVLRLPPIRGHVLSHGLDARPVASLEAHTRAHQIPRDGPSRSSTATLTCVVRDLVAEVDDLQKPGAHKKATLCKEQRCQLSITRKNAKATN